MPIGVLGGREVVVAPRKASAAQAARLMRQSHVGDVVVVDEVDGRQVPCGIVTDRDIVVAVVAKGLDPETILVGEIMTPELAVAEEHDGVAQTVALMRTKGIRRLPIVNAEGSLVGIVTADDLCALFTQELAALSALIQQERAVETERRV